MYTRHSAPAEQKRVAYMWLWILLKNVIAGQPGNTEDDISQQAGAHPEVT